MASPIQRVSTTLLSTYVPHPFSALCDRRDFVQHEKNHTTSRMAFSASSRFRTSLSIPNPHVLWVDGTEDRLNHVEQVKYPTRGCIRPCGRGSVGFAPLPSVSKQDEKYEIDSRRVRCVEYLTHPDDVPLRGESVRCPISVREIPSYLSCQESQRVATDKRVASGLTARGKKYIEDAIFCLERKYTVRRLGFFTLTLSFEDEPSVRLFNSRAADVLKRFLEKMRRHYERREQSFSYVGAWELHPSRSARCAIPILHFHYVAPCYYQGSTRFVATSDEIRNMWTDSVARLFGGRGIAACRIGSEVCRVSAARYLAKYVGKDSSCAGQGGCGERGVRLSSWYSISRPVLHCIRALTTSLGECFGQYLVSSFTRGNHLHCINCFGCVKRVIDGLETTVGWWFQVTDEFRDELLLTKEDSVLACI